MEDLEQQIRQEERRVFMALYNECSKLGPEFFTKNKDEYEFKVLSRAALGIYYGWCGGPSPHFVIHGIRIFPWDDNSRSLINSLIDMIRGREDVAQMTREINVLKSIQ